jgi:hypothetical protein
MNRQIGVLMAGLVWLGGFVSRAEDPMSLPQGKVRWIVSPIAGVDRNEMTVRTPMGTTTETDTGPEYGLFVMMAHPNFVVNDFLFFADVNETDVMGNLLFANYYADSKAKVTWNAGAGHLYHKIEPENEEIEVNVPMVKAGPLFRVPAWHLSLNPYLGYAWERVDTLHGDQDNDSYLYGLTVAYLWRMIEGGFNYYYQDSQEVDEDYQVFRARVYTFFGPNWGLGARVDYMEHMTTDDLSFLVGPAFTF